jgi:hypothetical protein
LIGQLQIDRLARLEINLKNHNLSTVTQHYDSSRRLSSGKIATFSCRVGRAVPCPPYLVRLEPKSSPNDGSIPRRSREICRFKNRANTENRGNREIREIRETGKLSREGSGFFAYFAYFAVQRISWARIWAGMEALVSAPGFR